MTTSSNCLLPILFYCVCPFLVYLVARRNSLRFLWSSRFHLAHSVYPISCALNRVQNYLCRAHCLSNSHDNIYILRAQIITWVMPRYFCIGFSSVAYSLATFPHYLIWLYLIIWLVDLITILGLCSCIRKKLPSER